MAIASRRGLKVGWVRVAAVLACLLAGLGFVAYGAAWLIVPSEGREDELGAERSGLVVLAQAFAICAGLVLLAALSAVATVFGFGWAVAAAGLIPLLAVLAGWPRLGPAWALLPLAGLTLPAAGVAAAGLRLAPQSGAAVVSPTAFTGGRYEAGLGTLVIDLRSSHMPGSGTMPLRIEGGIRRTIVALPHDRCVRVQVSYHVTPFLGHLAALLTGRVDRPFSDLVFFGTTRAGRAARADNLGAPGGGPVLKIDFTSMGGSLYVRDYPLAVNPALVPDWPGYPVRLEPRPLTTGLSRREARRELAAWQARLRVEAASGRQIGSLMPGPCGPVASG